MDFFQPIAFYRVEINSNSSCSGSCTQEFIGNNLFGSEGLTMSPEGDMYSTVASSIFIIDTLTGMQLLFYALPPPPSFPSHIGLVSTGSGIFYTISIGPVNPGDSLYRIDTNTGVITTVGNVGWNARGDITKFNGEFYYVGRVSFAPFQYGVIKLDINDPSNNELVTNLPVNWHVVGLTASNICNTLLAVNVTLGGSQLVYVNLIDGSITPICDLSSAYVITSMMEFGSPTICEVSLDLDCNDSSGADDADFNAEEFDCLSDPVQIADDDIGMMYDAIISE